MNSMVALTAFWNNCQTVWNEFSGKIKYCLE